MSKKTEFKARNVSFEGANFRVIKSRTTAGYFAITIQHKKIILPGKLKEDFKPADKEEIEWMETFRIDVQGKPDSDVDDKARELARLIDEAILEPCTIE